LGSVSFTVCPRESTAIRVIRCRPPPEGVVQPAGRFMKSLVLVVSTSVIVLVTAPVAWSYSV
jgi:hypothetical protein